MYLDARSQASLNRHLHGQLPSTLEENLESSFSSFIANDTSIAEDQGIGDLIQEQNERIRSVAGVEPPENPMAVIVPLIPGPDDLFLSLFDADQRSERQRVIEQYDRDIDLLRAQFPNAGLKTFGEITELNEERARALRERNDEIASRAGTGGKIGQFLGSSAGVFTDPTVLATLPFAPAAGTRLLGRVLFEAGVAGVSETVIQSQVVDFMERQGMTRQQAVERALGNILLATGGAAGVTGLLGLGAKAVGRLLGREVPAGQILDEAEAEGLRVTPEMRRDAEIVDRAVEVEEILFRPETPTELRRQLDLLGEATRSINQGKLTDRLLASTARIDPASTSPDLVQIRVETARATGRIDDLAQDILLERGRRIENPDGSVSILTFDDAVERALADATQQVEIRSRTGRLSQQAPQAEATEVIPAVKLRNGDTLFDAEAPNGKAIIDANELGRADVDQSGYIVGGHFVTNKRAANRVAKAIEKQRPYRNADLELPDEIKHDLLFPLEIPPRPGEVLTSEIETGRPVEAIAERLVREDMAVEASRTDPVLAARKAEAAAKLTEDPVFRARLEEQVRSAADRLPEEFPDLDEAGEIVGTRNLKDEIDRLNEQQRALNEFKDCAGV